MGEGWVAVDGEGRLCSWWPQGTELLKGGREGWGLDKMAAYHEGQKCNLTFSINGISLVFNSYS